MCFICSSYYSSCIYQVNSNQEFSPVPKAFSWGSYSLCSAKLCNFMQFRLEVCGLIFQVISLLQNVLVYILKYFLLRVSGLKLRSWIYFKFGFGGLETVAQFHHSVCWSPVSKHHLLKMLFFLWWVFTIFVRMVCLLLCMFLSYSSVLFHWSTCLFLY